MLNQKVTIGSIGESGYLLENVGEFKFSAQLEESGNVLDFEVNNFDGPGGLIFKFKANFRECMKGW